MNLLQVEPAVADAPQFARRLRLGKSKGGVFHFFEARIGGEVATRASSFAAGFQVTLQSFLSGADLLSNQTFLDLFVTETMVAGEGLTVQRLALLFTDLQGRLRCTNGSAT